MLKRKFFAFLLAACSACECATVHVGASFGSGTAVIAENTTLIKSGIYGEKICFTDCDFKSALGITDFKKITLTSVPSAAEGTLIYAGRRARAGQEIKRRNISSLVFLPSGSEVTEARFSFTADGFADGKIINCVLKFTDSPNEAPSTCAREMSASECRTSDSFTGTMYARDKEGDRVEFFIAAFPKNGSVEYSSDGTYTYTPSAPFHGRDSFSYVARDEWGNWSEPVKVIIRSD